MLDQSQLISNQLQLPFPSALVVDFKTSGPCKDLMLYDDLVFFLCKNEKIKAIEIGIFNTQSTLLQKKRG